MKANLAGRLADAFLDSKLTPLIMAAALGIGVWTLATMASEEEPQIVVPLADIYLPMPGASPAEIENRVLVPIENVVSGIDGVEYVYSHAESGFGLVTVRYEVGRDMEESLVKLYSTLGENADRMPPGMQMPLVKVVTIDDVPFFTVGLSGAREDGETLRRVADEVRVEFEQVPNVRDVSVIGGYPREIRVELLPEQLSSLRVDPAIVVQRLADANVQTTSGELVRDGEVVRVTAGPFLSTVADVEGVVLDVRNGSLVTVGDVARVMDGTSDVEHYTFDVDAGGSMSPLVTLAVAKRPGADATDLGHALEARLADLQGRVVPTSIDTRVTRNYGETAREKVVTLQEHLLMAILAVGLVVALAMGWRSALVVMVAVPITFALTLFVYQLFGYTLNRVTLFALIFVTGIVIDDSIIIAENMERHFAMKDRPLRAAARAAVDEVGNPTVLATLTVIAAVLPMLFVSGLMGPYMSPMPVGATVAMLFSLGVALIVTPWLAYRVLRHHSSASEGEGYVLEETRTYKVYRALMLPLLRQPRRLVLALSAVTVLLIGSAGMFVLRTVSVKMLPFDDKNELQVIVDMPEGTPLERTLALAQDLASATVQVDEVSDIQLYAGTAAPFNFNGMIRHYYLRSGHHVADLQVNLVEKGARSLRSHDVALVIRPIVDSIAAASGTGASVKVVEVPPGPPVLSTLVAEIYGPSEEARVALADEVRSRFGDHPSVVDIDWSLAEPRTEIRYEVDADRAALAGVDKAHVVGALRIGVGGAVATHLSAPESRTAVPVRVRLDRTARTRARELEDLRVMSASGTPVPVAELTRTVEATTPQVIDRKNGQRVVYVTAEVAGSAESPVYAILDLRDEIETEQFFTAQPTSTERPSLRWDGEWTITYEVFRDLGIAFGGALVLIYVLIVAWFGSFVTPLVMMAAIPLTLVGIAPGHVIFGSFFTATSMIGMIALAGIMVRNGILLLDYLEARRAQGIDLETAVLEAGAVRTRPIALTAGTVVIGAVVILFDPIFEGLAVSLITGALASTVLTLIVVPGLYFLLRSRSTEAPTPDTTVT